VSASTPVEGLKVGEAFAAEVFRVERALIKLRANLEADMKVKNPNWGHVGSLQKAAFDLETLNAFLAGED
jgi:hypothetical protein